MRSGFSLAVMHFGGMLNQYLNISYYPLECPMIRFFPTRLRLYFFAATLLSVSCSKNSNNTADDSTASNDTGTATISGTSGDTDTVETTVSGTDARDTTSSAATCDDGVMNGNEQDVDCGGPCAACYSRHIYIQGS